MERTVIFSSDAEIVSFNVSNFVYTSGDILKSEADAIVIPVNPLLKESDVSHIVREAGNIKAFFAFFLPFS